MKIIALKGPNSCGKTTTLNLVYDELIKLGATIVVPKKVIGNPSDKDFECILNYTSKQIGIYTLGDFSKGTIEAIKKYDSLGVDILILATNDKFSRPTPKILTYTNVIITKTINTTNNLVANTTDCFTVISHI